MSAFGGLAKHEMTRDQPTGRVDLPLAVECLQQSLAESRDVVGKVVEPIAIFARQPRWRHVEISGEVDRHRPVKHPARCLAPNNLRGVCPDPLQRLVNGVGISKDVKAVSQSACSFALPKRATRRAAA
jgi:hypothetical protein